ncbi:hypothetical protein Tco_0661916 [Tanacetum coccineum]
MLRRRFEEPERGGDEEKAFMIDLDQIDSDDDAGKMETDEQFVDEEQMKTDEMMKVDETVHARTNLDKSSELVEEKDVTVSETVHAGPNLDMSTELLEKKDKDQEQPASGFLCVTEIVEPLVEHAWTDMKLYGSTGCDTSSDDPCWINL